MCSEMLSRRTQQTPGIMYVKARLLTVADAP